jgi:hypothetical protein
MVAAVRYRNTEVEARERARFRVLAHVHGRAGADETAPVLCARVADELGLLRLEAAELIEDLLATGLLADAGAGPYVRITPAGIAFLERVAGRRRSVRGSAVPPSSAKSATGPLWSRVLQVNAGRSGR